MIQPNELSKTTCALPPPNEMILRWVEERPNEVYLKQIIFFLNLVDGKTQLNHFMKLNIKNHVQKVL